MVAGEGADPGQAAQRGGASPPVADHGEPFERTRDVLLVPFGVPGVLLYVAAEHHRHRLRPRGQGRKDLGQALAGGRGVVAERRCHRLEQGEIGVVLLDAGSLGLGQAARFAEQLPALFVLPQREGPHAGEHHHQGPLGRRRLTGYGEHDPRPAGTLAALPLQEPEPRERRHQANREVGALDLHGGTDGRDDVLVLGAQPGQPDQLVGAAQLDGGRLGVAREAPRVRRHHRDPLAGLGDALLAVRAHRLQQPVPRLARVVDHRLDQRLVDQRGEDVEHSLARELVVGADLLGEFEGRAAVEDRQPPQQHPLGFLQQVPAPLHHRPQRLVPRQDGTSARGEQPEPVVETVGDLGHRQRPEPGGGEFDREGQAVESAADLHHGVDVLGRDLEVGAYGDRTVGEEPDRGVHQRR